MEIMIVGIGGHGRESILDIIALAEAEGHTIIIAEGLAVPMESPHKAHARKMMEFADLCIPEPVEELNFSRPSWERSEPSQTWKRKKKGWNK